MKWRDVERSKTDVYRRKARNFFQGALDAMQRGNWDSVGLQSIHCAISAVDMLTVAFGGRRSVSSNHLDAVTLLDQILPGRETAEQSPRLRDILGKKNLVEYEDRGFTRKEAEDILKKCERFLAWAEKRLA